MRTFPVVGAVGAARLRQVPSPRRWSARVSDASAILLANALLVVAMWVRHGGLDQLGTLAGILTAVGQVTALLGTCFALVGMLLMSRTPWLDQALGTERLQRWHRWIGFTTIWLLVAHAVFTTLGFALADGIGPLEETWALLTGYPYVLMSAVSLLLFIAVAVFSIRAARRRLSYETWYGIHLYVYLAIALAFLHQLAVGTDFVDDPVARAYWVTLYIVVGTLLLVFRVGGPLKTTLIHRPRVAAVVREAPDVVSLYLTGHRLDELPARAGQYFQLRFLARGNWWRSHPYSLSAAPDGQRLRFTIKALGDDSRAVADIPVGTRVLIEGPYGQVTLAERSRRGVALIAGGIGITPIRALLEELPFDPGAVTLIYRVSSPRDLVFRAELEDLARSRGVMLHVLAGRRGSRAMPVDPLQPHHLLGLVPDIASSDVYVFGSAGFVDRVSDSLDKLRVPRSQVHSERFSH